MKNAFLAVSLIAVLFSCKKNHDADNPGSPLSGELTSMRQFYPEVNTLNIDSLEFNNKHQLARLKIINYSGAKDMSLPANFNPATHDSTLYGVFTFNYAGNDTLATGYTLTVMEDGVTTETKTFGLQWDVNGKVITDSVVGGVPDCMGYTFVKKTRYKYAGNLTIVSQERCDGSTEVDSLFMNNDNIVEDRAWVYNEPTIGDFHASTSTATYSTIESPFYKYKPLRSYFFGLILLSNEVLPVISSNLEATYKVTYYAPTTGDLGRILQWQADDKGRAASGTIKFDFEPSNTEYIQFNYAK